MTGSSGSPRPDGPLVTSDAGEGNGFAACVDCSMWCTCALQVAADDHTPRAAGPPSRRAFLCRHGYTTPAQSEVGSTAGRAPENPRKGRPVPGPQLFKDRAHQGEHTGSVVALLPQREPRLNTPVLPGAEEALWVARPAGSGWSRQRRAMGSRWGRDRETGTPPRLPHSARLRITRSSSFASGLPFATPSPEHRAQRPTTRRQRSASHVLAGWFLPTVDASVMIPAHPTDTPPARPATRGARVTARRTTHPAPPRRGEERTHARPRQEHVPRRRTVHAVTGRPGRDGGHR